MITVEKGDFRVGRKKFRYQVDSGDGPVPTRSVTEILEVVFGKGKFGAGAWWGQGVALAAVTALIEQGALRWDAEKGCLCLSDGTWVDDEMLIQLLKDHKLTTNHTRDKAADRGTAIHDAAERYAMTGAIPNPMDFPEEQRGYLRAFAMFLVDHNPTFLDTEVTVASAEHGYAGTFDMRCKINGKGVGLGDYKTGKRLYESVFFQLEAYEVASVEMGNPPTDFRFAVHLGEDGTYGYEESTVTPEEWVAQVEAWKAQSAAEERRKA
jgi:hypothetical protein